MKMRIAGSGTVMQATYQLGMANGMIEMMHHMYDCHLEDDLLFIWNSRLRQSEKDEILEALAEGPGPGEDGYSAQDEILFNLLSKN